MKIVHLLLTRRFAGSERYAVELANMQAAEHEVFLILHKNAAEQRADATAPHVSDKVKIVYVSNIRPLAVLQARRALKRLRPDVSHAHLSWGCRALASLHKEAGVRVATLHITYKRKQHEKLDGLIAIAPWQMPLLPEKFRDAAVQVDNWSFPAQAASGARERLRNAYGINPDTHVFGTLGRLDRSKGLEVVIKAFQKAKMPNTKLVIVGDGKARAELQALAGENVIFVGYSSEPRDWLACFDTFVSAARSEPFGLVFLEAMHARLPIIASASEGAQNLAPHWAQPLIEIDDVDGFKEAFAHAAKSVERPVYDMARFDPAARCGDVLNFYTRLRERVSRS